MLVATPQKNKSKPCPSFAQRKGLLVWETREVREGEEGNCPRSLSRSASTTRLPPSHSFPPKFPFRLPQNSDSCQDQHRGLGVSRQVATLSSSSTRKLRVRGAALAARVSSWWSMLMFIWRKIQLIFLFPRSDFHAGRSCAQRSPRPSSVLCCYHSDQRVLHHVHRCTG